VSAGAGAIAADVVRTIALCWRVERRDGVTIGLTAHDRDVTIDGLVHRAAPGMTPSAVERSDGLEADTMDVGGALTSAAIAEVDLIAGRWDGARVVVMAVDWESRTTVAALGEGTIGAVETSAAGFTAELAGMTAALQRPVVEETSAACRARLGDARCRVSMQGRRRFARVVASEAEVMTLDAEEPSANGYAGGTVRWFGGRNSGLSSAVAASAGATVTLRMPPAFPVVPGVLVDITEGCDKMLATCADRFGNAANFRGEPFLPGIDLLTRYPGG
jgi:uncharacterized phage protein (TIGR02218 family)